MGRSEKPAPTAEEPAANGSRAMLALKLLLVPAFLLLISLAGRRWGPEVAGWLAPMPGGTGPMTRAMLLANVVEAAERAAGLA